jgi:thymidylate synthase
LVTLGHCSVERLEVLILAACSQTLSINPNVTDIDGFKFSDFEMVGYKPQATIKMKMAV